MARVLTVDDEPDVQFLLKVTLEMAGHEVEQAEHGEAALERIRATRPDIVVTDLMMPVMDGKELIATMRSSPDLAQIPIVVLSAAPDNSLPADKVMRKPFAHHELVAQINLILSGVA